MVLVTSVTNFSKASREDQYYLRVDEQSLKLFAEEMQVRMEGRSITNIEEFNATMKSVAEEKLEARYRRRLINKQETVKEKPWVTEQVRREIKKRKSLNREKRNANTEEEKEKLYDEYQKQKEVTKLLVKEEISKHEIKVTEEIRQSACKSKALWENISKLRGKPVAKHTEIHLFTEEGKPMEEQDENAFLDFWEKVYQKHDNRIDVVWNRETRQRYISELENQHEALELGSSTFPCELREHIDMIAQVKKPPSVMAEPEIMETDVIKCIQKMKNKTAAGPDELKPELYKALLGNKKCLEVITACFQEELNKCSKPAEWKTSKTKMIPKIAKPMAKDLRPIALTNVSYKLYMSLEREVGTIPGKNRRDTGNTSRLH